MSVKIKANGAFDLPMVDFPSEAAAREYDRYRAIWERCYYSTNREDVIISADGQTFHGLSTYRIYLVNQLISKIEGLGGIWRAPETWQPTPALEPTPAAPGRPAPASAGGMGDVLQPLTGIGQQAVEGQEAQAAAKQRAAQSAQEGQERFLRALRGE